MTGDRCLAMGCNEYITKPIDREAFMKAVEKYCGAENLVPILKPRP
jgi:CheY-like chemotaxis protein